MSRSYHTTRRHLREARQFRESDSQRQAALIERLKKQLRTKRRLKKCVRCERRELAVPAITPVDAIPVVTTTDLPFVHFPASPADLRAILNLLPRGSADGLRQITLELGDQWESCEAFEDKALSIDPFVGRRGFEVLPGVFMAYILGQYLPARRKIRLAGVLYDSALANQAVWEVYLRLQMLMTFVHEVAHHCDFSGRIARGRWRGDDKEKIEIYAESMAHQWIISVIIPYIEREYADDMTCFRAWMKTHAGAEIPLSILAGEVRSTAKNGRLWANAAFFNTSNAFQRFASAIIHGEDPTAARIQWARELHYAEHYQLAKETINTVLSSNPRHTEALSLLGDIAEHEEHYERALALANQALAIDANCVDAMEVAADCYLAISQWHELIAMAERLVASADTQHARWNAIYHRARGQMEIGNTAAALLDINELAGAPKFIQRRTQKLMERLTELQCEIDRVHAKDSCERWTIELKWGSGSRLT